MKNKGANTMKKILAIFAAAVILLLGGCMGETTTSNSGKGSIDPAVFCIEDARYPRISIKENNEFLILYNVSASRMTTGTYTVSEDEILTLNADDGAVYNFQIMRTSIVFIAENSSDFEKQDGDNFEITDGTKFYLWRKYSPTTAVNSDNA